MEIKLNNCEIKINENIILENVNAEIIEGNFYRITGANGSGKTVLMNTLLGIYTNVKEKKKIIYEKHNICYIGDVPFFFDNDKISDVTDTICFFYRTDKEILRQIYKNMDIDFESLKGKKIFELSKGMRKK
ncbi:MAG: ATP-binding cassette domain-containing protein [Breznakia sp.]